jgi:ribonucleotide monophosphatase NagD (HAD superfamily)
MGRAARRCAPHADALDRLVRLRAAGKRVVLLSNSGKRTAINRARLAEIGIGPSLYMPS